jgi:hypothetical protein
MVAFRCGTPWSQRSRPTANGQRNRPRSLNYIAEGLPAIEKFEPHALVDFPLLKMAPGRVDEPSVVSNSPSSKSEKPTVYLLDTFHPEATSYAQNVFNAVLPSDPRHSEWREKAEYLLIRSSYLTAADVESCPNLKAIGKQGVGRLNVHHCGI